MSQKDDELLTTGEVAAVLRVSPKSVRRWINQGRLPAIKTPGRTNRVRRSDLNRIAGI